MYVAIEKLEHGLTRTWGKPSPMWLILRWYEYAKETWTERGYTILESIHGQAIILDGTRAIGVIEVKRLSR